MRSTASRSDQNDGLYRLVLEDLPRAQREAFVQLLDELRSGIVAPVRNASPEVRESAFDLSAQNLVLWAGRVAQMVGLDFTRRLVHSFASWLQSDVDLFAGDENNELRAGLAVLARCQIEVQPYVEALLREPERRRALPQHVQESAEAVVRARGRCELAIILVLDSMSEGSTAEALPWRVMLSRETASLSATLDQRPRWAADLARAWTTRILTPADRAIRADLAIVDPESSDVVLVAEIGAGDSRSPVRERALKRHMLARRCPLGLLVTPVRITLLRDTYASHDESSVEIVASAPAPAALGDADISDVQRMTDAVAHWLTSIAEDAVDTTHADDEVNEVTSVLAPWIRGCRIVVEAVL